MVVAVGTTLDFNGPLIVTELLGSGGEGDVFQVASPDGESRFALKWFHERTATPERREQIEMLVDRGAPSAAFLWPQGIVEGAESGRFGYVMPLRPDGFVGLAALLRGTVHRNEANVVRFAFELAHSFLRLHTLGLCYRDINFGNAFMNPDTGEALICDNDNVGIEGVGEAQVLGSKKFMAPEIVRGEAMPSKYTDRYSMAVMLFYLLLVHHPLEGAATEVGLIDAEAELRFYGYAPRFCLDPKDTSNRPVPELHTHVPRMWDSYPSSIRKLFTRSFTNNMANPVQRVVDSEWCDALGAMRSGYFPCSHCGGACFLDAGHLRPSCSHCEEHPTPPLILKLDRRNVVLREGVSLVPHHFNNDFDFGRILATVQRHPTEVGVLGLRNDSDSVLEYCDVAGQQHQVPPGLRASLSEGAQVKVGGQWGTIALATTAPAQP